MIVDKWRNVIFVEMSVEEQTLMVRALRGYAANLSRFRVTARTPNYVNKLKNRVEQYKDLADCLESVSV